MVDLDGNYLNVKNWNVLYQERKMNHVLMLLEQHL